MDTRGTATLRCEAMGFQPRDVHFTWKVNDQETALPSQSGPATLHGNGTYTSSSFLKVPVREWDSGSTFTCLVQHLSSSTPRTQSLSKQDVPPSSPPSVYLQYPPPGEISAGAPTSLLCLVTGFYPPPVQISWYLDGSKVLSGISEWPLSRDLQDRYTSVSRLETSVRDWVDTERYRCVVSHRTLSQPIAKEVSTSARYPTAPTLYILPPTYAEMDTRGTATLRCEAMGFQPRDVHFTWKVNDQETALPSQSGPATLHGNGTYTSSSFLKVPVREWDSGSTFTCLVQHLSSSTPRTQSLSKQDVSADMKVPVVQVMDIEQQEASGNGSTSTLACFVSGFYPGDIYLTWRSQGSEVTDGVTTFPVTMDSEGTFHVVSQLSVPTETRERGQIFSCVVGHQSLKERIDRPVRKEPVRPPTPPSIRIIPPSIREILTNQTATLSCVATLFYPATIWFRWFRAQSDMSDHSQTSLPVGNLDGTSSSRSILRVTAEEWSSGSSYTCQVAHEALATPLSRSVSVRDISADMKVPVVQVMDIEQQEASGNGSTSTLACFVSGFYPGDIYLTWRSQGSEVTDGVTTFPVTTDSEGTFHVVSQLSVPTETRERGQIFSCVVGHQSLKEPLDRPVRKEPVRPPTPPSIRIIPPSIREILTNQTATLSCVATLFYPATIRFRWFRAQSDMSDHSQTSLPVGNLDGTSSSRSILRVTAEEWSSGGSYTCQVAHEALATPLSRSVSVRDISAELKVPVVQVMDIEQQEASGNESTSTLACFVSGFYPGDIYLTWRSQDSEVTDGVTTFPVTTDSEGTFHVVSQLSVPTETRERGQIFSCVVGHQSLKERIDRPVRKEPVRPPTPPSIRITPPSIREILTNQTATLSCVATLFYPATIWFRWFQAQSDMSDHSQTSLPVRNLDGTSSSRSILRVTAEEWSSGGSYTCQVTHEALATPLSRSVSVQDISAELKVPVVQVMDIEQQEASGNESTSTLACFVSGFYPGDIYLTWRSQGSEVTDRVTTFPVTTDSEGTFHVVSQLSVPTETRERGQIFSCVVGHQSLKERIDRPVRKEPGIFRVLGQPAWLWTITAVGALTVYTVILIVIVTYSTTACSKRGKGE
ncbi:titin-like [Carcharodon carcharias]|uniref:titin-like n=1 Tax=Carcharodon carcharias TaxID=13397 RepID=UPI001B7ED21B|nr:titin-like [Carcharodon carcharias]